MSNKNWLGIMVAAVVAVININSARADACSGTCFDSTTQACTIAATHQQCNGGSNRICCPSGGKVSNLASAGIRIEKIDSGWGDKEEFVNGVVTVAWDRNLAEKPVRLGFKTTPTGQVVRVAEGGRDPLHYGVDVTEDTWYVLDEGNHGVINACVVIGEQCHGFTVFAAIEVKREKAPQQNKLIKATFKASQMNPAALRAPDPTPVQLETRLASGADQLDRIETGVLDLRSGKSAKFMRVLAATAGGAVLGAVLGGAFSDTTLGGASKGGAYGAGVGLVVGGLWAW